MFCTMVTICFYFDLTFEFSSAEVRIKTIFEMGYMTDILYFDLFEISFTCTCIGPSTNHTLYLMENSLCRFEFMFHKSN